MPSSCSVFSHPLVFLNILRQTAVSLINRPFLSQTLSGLPKMTSLPSLMSPRGWPVADRPLVITPAPSRPATRTISPTTEASSAKRLAAVTGDPRLETVVYYRIDNHCPPQWAITLTEGQDCQCFVIALGMRTSTNRLLLDVIFIDDFLPLVVFPSSVPNNQTLSLEPNLAPRHILLPFNFRVNWRAILSERNTRTLGRIYPGTQQVDLVGQVLIFTVADMPPRPWPKTVAGVTPHFTPASGPSTMSRPYGFSILGPDASVLPGKDGRHMDDWRPLFMVLRAHFERIGVPITEVIYRWEYIVIILESRDADVKKLPRSVTHIRCLYLYDDEMWRPPIPRPCLQEDAIHGNPDETEYCTL